MPLSVRSAFVAISSAAILMIVTSEAVHSAEVLRLLAMISHLQAEHANDDDDLPKNPPKNPPKDPKGSPQRVRPEPATITIFENGTVAIVDKNGKTLLARSSMTLNASGAITVNGKAWGVLDSSGAIVIGKKRPDGPPHAAFLRQLRTALASAASAKDAANRPPAAGILGGGSPGFSPQGPAPTGTPSKPAVIY